MYAILCDNHLDNYIHQKYPSSRVDNLVCCKWLYMVIWWTGSLYGHVRNQSTMLHGFMFHIQYTVFHKVFWIIMLDYYD